MRALLLTVVVLGAALVGYRSAPAVVAQGVQLGPAGVIQGEKVRLVSEPDRGAQECTVVAVRGDFLGCKNDRQTIGMQGYTRWYNLRHVVRIDRPGQD